MNNLAKRVLISAIGLVLVLGWWTLQGKFSKNGTQTVDRVPAKVWEGGGATLTIETEASDPATLRALFQSTERHNGTPVRSLDSIEKIPAGSHSWTIDVPAAVGGNLEIEALNPKAGSRLHWKVTSAGKILRDETEALTTNLRGNEGFFLNIDEDDFSHPQVEAEE